MKWKAWLLSVATFLGFMVPASLTVEAATLQVAGHTDCGILYINTDEVRTLSKDGAVFLSVVAEEKYTDTGFLESLRKDEDLRNVVSAMYLYLFDNRGSSYCVAANYLIDAQGKVCLDMGPDMQMKQLTSSDKTLVNAYMLSLKVLEKKKMEQDRLNRWKKKF